MDVDKPNEWQARISSDADVSKLSITLLATNLEIEGSANNTVRIRFSREVESNLAIKLDEKSTLSISPAPDGGTGTAGRTPRLQASIPPGLMLHISLSERQIRRNDLRGSIEGRTVPADGIAQAFAGSAWIRSARAAISVRDSCGDLHLIGEGRPVEIENCQGIISATTIPGALRGGFINVLVTDNYAATQLLELV